MKKILLLVPLIFLLAAGCNQAIQNNNASQNNSGQNSQQQSQNNSGQSGTNAQSQQPPVQGTSNIDDITNSLQKSASDIQSNVTQTDNTDILNSDSTASNNLTGAVNENSY